MKKILIISYYYPPNNNIPSWRPYSWANYFSTKGPTDTEVHVVCRFWDGHEKHWKDLINPTKGEHTHIVNRSPNLDVHYVATSHVLNKVLALVRRVSLLNRSFHYLANRAGFHDIETDAYFSFKKYIQKTFADNYFDTVIVTSPPVNLIRLGYVLRKKFKKALFVADFRDLWNTEELKISYSPTRKERVYNSSYKKHIKKWFSRFNLLTGISHSLVEKLAELDRDIATEVITNGYEKELFADSSYSKQTNTFTISSVGTVYPLQNYKILLNGIIDFVKSNPDAPIQVQFIGTRSMNPGLTELLESELPGNTVTVSDRIDRKRALAIMKNANVLVYPAWTGYRGIYPGKLFEYLAAGNNILVAPGDKDVIDDLLTETKAGVSKDTKEEVTFQLQQWYNEWKEKGSVSYHGITGKIEKYSRENQAQKLADTISALIRK